MKACVDVHYQGEEARVALVQFHDWPDAIPAAVDVFNTGVTASYVPGEFYQRELDPILLALKRACTSWEVVIMDGLLQPVAGGQEGTGGAPH